MEKFSQTNLNSIKKRFPDLYEKIIKGISTDCEITSVYLDDSVKDEKIIAVNKNNRLWYLNSRYSAIEAAQIWADGFLDINYRGIIILCGMSNMMYVKTLLKKLGKDNIVMLYEPSEEIFFKVLEEIDIQEVLEDCRLFYFIENINMDSFRMYCKALFEYERIDLSRISISPNYNEIYESKIQAFITVCESELSNFQVYKNTYILYGSEMNDNLIDNIPHSIYTSSIDNIKTEIDKMDISDVPAIIVAAGPSLDKNIDELQKAQGKSLIIAVDSSIRALLQRNIIPDLLVTTDPHKPMILFDDERALNIPLIVCMHTRYDIMVKHVGKKFMFSDSEYIANIYNRFNKVISALETGGSVANTAFSMAKYLGFKKIILMGQDLAFTNNKKHADNVYDEKSIGEDESDSYTEVEGIDGKPILTFINFKLYRDWFEAEIRDNPDINVINATEGGAKIHGACNQTLNNAIQSFCKKEIDFKKPIAESKDSFSENEKSQYYQLFHDMVDKSKELDKKFKSGIRYYHKLKELMCKGKSDSGEFARILKNIKEINNIGNLEPFMELISMYAKEDEYNITHNIYKVDYNVTLEEDGSVIADKGIAMLKAYIKANKKALDRIEKVLVRNDFPIN